MRHLADLARLPSNRPLFVFGAGPGGSLLHQALTQAGHMVVAFIDDTRPGPFHGCPIVNLHTFAAAAPADAVVLIASQHWRAIARQFRQAGHFDLIDASGIIRAMQAAPQRQRIQHDRLALDQSIRAATGLDAKQVLTSLQPGDDAHRLVGQLRDHAGDGATTLFIQGTGRAARIVRQVVEQEPALHLAGFFSAEKAGFQDYLDVCPQDQFWTETTASADTVLIFTEADNAAAQARARVHGFTRLIDAGNLFAEPSPRRPWTGVARPAVPSLAVVLEDGATLDSSIAAQVRDRDGDALGAVLTTTGADVVAWCRPGFHLGAADAAAALALLSRGDETGAVLICADGHAPSLLDTLLAAPAPLPGILLVFASALAAVTEAVPPLHPDATAFDLWCRLSCDFDVVGMAATDSRLVPVPWPAALQAELEGRVSVINDLFAPEGFLGQNEEMHQQALLRQFAACANAGLGQAPGWATIAVPPLPARLYGAVARRFEERGQFAAAMASWDQGLPLGDASLDSDSCQAFLKAPFTSMAAQYRRMRAWASRHASITSRRWDGPTDWDQRPIRVGYACACSTAAYFHYQVMPFVARHDRSRFVPYFYLDQPVAKAHASSEHVRVTSQLDDDAFAAQIRADGIDILVELTGFSPGHRYGAMASRCAPVQISYVNHTGTSGTANVDYCLADAIACPPELDRWFTERVWRLPGSFFCFDFRDDVFPALTPPPLLERGHVQFGCFASASKINPVVIALWADLLKRVPGSRLVLCNPALRLAANRDLTYRRFAWAGIGPERLDLHPGMDRDGIKRLYGDIDISLDTWPYCGGNTIAESLMCGVPAITWQGETFAARYGASLLTASGLSSLVAHDRVQFLDIASRLAGDPERLSDLRANLRTRMFHHGFSDSASFVLRLETAYLAMLDRLKGNRS